MAGAERLKEKILSDARRQAEQNVGEARREAEALILKAREEAKALYAGIVTNADKDAAAHEKRMISNAELEGRKDRLSARQSLIDELFKKSVARIGEKSDKDYEAMLLNMLTLSANGDETVVVSPKDKKRLSGGFVESANKALAEKGKMAKLKLAEKTREMSGGFVLLRGEVEINNSFESIIRIQKDSLEALAVKMLFSDTRNQ